LERGDKFHGNDYGGKRVLEIVASVTEWIDDPQVAERQVGWVTEGPALYVRPVRRIAVRCRKKNGQWGIGVLVSTLSDEEVIALTRQPCHLAQDPPAVLLAMVHFYDRRGGGVGLPLRKTIKDWGQ
jgi:hypothetical protein